MNEIIADKTGLGETGEIYIINKEGYAITPLLFKKDTFLKFKVDSEIARNCLAMLDGLKEGEVLMHIKHEHVGHEASFVYADYRGTDVLGSHYLSHEINWCVLAKIDEAEALASSEELLKFSAMRVLIVLLVFFVLALLLAKMISRPIGVLRRGTEIIEGGDLNHKVGTETKDEIGQLSRSFDKMTMAIKKSRAEIDNKVTKQTDEIAQKAQNLADQQTATLNVLEDVEEEKKNVSEEKDKIDAILHSIGDGVFVVDKDLKISIFNQVAADISGYSIKEAVGKKYDQILNFIFEKDGKTNDKFIKEAMASGEVKEMANHTLLIRKDGVKVAVADSAAPLKDKRGGVTGCVVVFRDVSREREIDQAKTEFVSLASHQLRTPLSSINWYTEMLLDGDAGKLTKEQKEYLQEIYRGNHRMVELVNALLNVSRLELGTFMIEPEKVNLKKKVKEIVRELKQKIEGKKQKLTEKYKGKIDKYDGDPKLLMIIFQNLLSNAVKYTPEGGKIEVGVVNNGRIVEIKVADSGMGIPKKQQKRIFEKLFRADNVRETDTQGTGLGLYIIKQIVDHCGGKVWFESKEKKGTTFYVQLPASGMKKRKGTKKLG